MNAPELMEHNHQPGAISTVNELVYAPTEHYFDHTWSLADSEKVK